MREGRTSQMCVERSGHRGEAGRQRRRCTRRPLIAPPSIHASHPPAGARICAGWRPWCARRRRRAAPRSWPPRSACTARGGAQEGAAEDVPWAVAERAACSGCRAQWEQPGRSVPFPLRTRSCFSWFRSCAGSASAMALQRTGGAAQPSRETLRCIPAARRRRCSPAVGARWHACPALRPHSPQPLHQQLVVPQDLAHAPLRVRKVGARRRPRLHQGRRGGWASVGPVGLPLQRAQALSAHRCPCNSPGCPAPWARL